MQILEVHPVGNYAVRLVFDDMHSTGIFSWDYLSELGRNREQYWRDYLRELAEKHLSGARSGAARFVSSCIAPDDRARRAARFCDFYCR